MAGIKATIRTVNAIKKADQLVGNGTSVKSPTRINSGTTNGDTYNGMFAVTNTSDEIDQKISVINGLDATLTDCGRIQANGFMVDVVVAELTITAEAYIYLEAELVYNEEDPPVAIDATIEVKQQATELTFETGFARQLVSHVTFDSTITNFSRENISQFMHVIESC